jgi:hypothetical protein
VYRVLWRNLNERDHRGDPGVDRKIIYLHESSGRKCGGMDWIGLAQGRNKWRTIVNAVMNLRVP